MELLLRIPAPFHLAAIWIVIAIGLSSSRLVSDGVGLAIWGLAANFGYLVFPLVVVGALREPAGLSLWRLAAALICAAAFVGFVLMLAAVGENRVPALVSLPGAGGWIGLQAIAISAIRNGSPDRSTIPLLIALLALPWGGLIWARRAALAVLDSHAA